MSLKQLPTDAPYIHRKRINVSAHAARSNNDQSGRWDIFDYVFEVPGSAQNVVSMELTNYIVPKMYQTPFPLASPGIKAARYLDMKIEYASDPTKTLTLNGIEFPYRTKFVSALKTMTFLTGSYANLGQPPVTGVIWSALSNAADANFNAADIDIVTVQDGEMTNGTFGTFHIKAVAVPGGLYDGTTFNLYFLFGSGPNKDSSVYQALGYDYGVDVGGPQTLPSGTVVSWPVPVRPVNFWPRRYVDVNIHEVDEFAPHSRIFLCSSGDYVNNNTTATDGVRLITKPPRRLDTLHVRITGPQGTACNAFANDPHSLTFDLLLALPEVRVPAWIKQQLEF